MKHILAILLLFLLTSCATEKLARKPSEYLLTTDKSSSKLFKDLRVKLEEQKYVVKKDDENAGLMILAPRKFSFDMGDHKVAAHQSLLLRQEGGSLKVRMAYECNYANDGKTFVPCIAGDESQAKINRLEPALIEMMRPVLMKHGDVEEAAPADAKNQDAAKDIKKDSMGW